MPRHRTGTLVVANVPPAPRGAAAAPHARTGGPSLSYYSGPVTLRLCGLTKVGGGGTPVGADAVLATYVATVVDGLIVDVVDWTTGGSVLRDNGSGSGLPAADAYLLLDASGVNLHVTATLGSVLQVNFNDWSPVANVSVADDVPYLTTAGGTYLIDLLYEVVGTPDDAAAAAAAQCALERAWEVTWEWVLALALLVAAAVFVLPSCGGGGRPASSGGGGDGDA